MVADVFPHRFFLVEFLGHTYSIEHGVWEQTDEESFSIDQSLLNSDSMHKLDLNEVSKTPKE